MQIPAADALFPKQPPVPLRARQADLTQLFLLQQNQTPHTGPLGLQRTHPGEGGLRTFWTKFWRQLTGEGSELEVLFSLVRKCSPLLALMINF